MLTILAIQQYFDHIWNEAVYEKVLAPPSEQLQRGSRPRRLESDALHVYGQGVGPGPDSVDRAMELNLQEAAAGKTFYPAKEYVPKKEEPALPAATPGAATPNVPATPPAVMPEKK